MNYAGAMLARLRTDFADFPPLSFFRGLHAICVQLDALAAYNEIADHQIGICLHAIAKKLPESFKQSEQNFYADSKRWMDDEESYNRGPCVPIADILPINECILLIHAFFCDGPIRDAGLFAQVRRQLFLNEAAYHRVSLVDVQRGRQPSITEVDEEPVVLIDKFLGGTPFHHFFKTTYVPFKVPSALWTSHAFILGPERLGEIATPGLDFARGNRRHQ